MRISDKIFKIKNEIEELCGLRRIFQYGNLAKGYYDRMLKLEKKYDGMTYNHQGEDSLSLAIIYFLENNEKTPVAKTKKR